MALSSRYAGLRLSDPIGPPELDADGRVRSIQAAELAAPRADHDAFCSPAGLERLGRAYWSYLRRISLGLIHVRGDAAGCRIVFLGRPLVLLAFAAPRLAHGDDAGSISWPITGGLLLSRRHRENPGVLRISVKWTCRRGGDGDALRVEVAVLGFPPSIASTLGAGVYAATQSRIHVSVTRGFLRRLYRETRRATSGPSTGPS